MVETVDAVEKCIQILQYAIDHKITIKRAEEDCGVKGGYVKSIHHRKGKLKTKHPRYDELTKLRNKVKLKEYRKVVTTQEVDELLDKDFIVDQDRVTFQAELENKGILDARGNLHIKTIDQLVSEAKIDLNVWEIVDPLVNKWDVTNADGQTYQNWQVKAKLHKRQEIEDAIKFDDFFKDLLSKHDPYKYKPVAYKKKKEDNLLEISIYDLHLGKLCWSEEVENNYDTKIASARFNYALQKLVQRAEAFQYERILFVVGNDFFNADGHLNQTTMGTRQDEDSRWQKTFKTGERLIIEGIDYLRQYAPVDVKVIPGNHDYLKSFMLGEVLSAWYRNDSCVSIDNSANPRKYYVYGNLLLGLTHGNNEKPEALRSLMAFEAKELWANTIYKEWHVGHQHRKLSYSHIVKSNMIHEELGITIRHMSSLAGTDAWHHTMNYVGPIRAAEAFLWNKESGLIGNFNVNIKLNDDK